MHNQKIQIFMENFFTVPICFFFLVLLYQSINISCFGIHPKASEGTVDSLEIFNAFCIFQ